MATESVVSSMLKAWRRPISRISDDPDVVDHPYYHLPGKRELGAVDNVPHEGPSFDYDYTVSLEERQPSTLQRICNRLHCKSQGGQSRPPSKIVLRDRQEEVLVSEDLPPGMENAHLVGVCGNVACLANYTSYCLWRGCGGEFVIFPKSKPAKVEDEIWGLTRYYQDEDSSAWSVSNSSKRVLPSTKLVFKIVRIFRHQSACSSKIDSAATCSIETVTLEMKSEKDWLLKAASCQIPPPWRFVSVEGTLPRLACFGIFATCEDEMMYIPLHSCCTSSSVKNLVAFDTSQEKFHEINLPEPPCEMPRCDRNGRPMFFDDLFTAKHLMRMMPRRLPTSSQNASYEKGCYLYLSRWDAKVLTYHQPTPQQNQVRKLWHL